MAPELTVSRRLVELLDANVSEVQIMTLATITDLVRYDQQHSQVRAVSSFCQCVESILMAVYRC